VAPAAPASCGEGAQALAGWSESAERRRMVQAQLNGKGQGTQHQPVDEEMAKLRVAEGVEAKLQTARKEHEDEAENFRKQRFAMEAQIRDRTGGNANPTAEEALSYREPDIYQSKAPVYRGQNAVPQEGDEGFHDAKSAAQKVETARKQADSELERMRAAIHGEGEVHPPVQQVAVPQKQHPNDSAQFFHRGRIFPFSSPREEASKAKQEQKVRLETVIGNSIDKARKRRMDMEMEYASAVVRAQQSKEQFEVKKAELGEAVDGAFDSIQQISATEFPILAAVEHPSDELHDIIAAAVCLVADQEQDINLDWPVVCAVLADHQGLLSLMKPGALSAGELVASLPKKAVWASRSILDGAKLTNQKVAGLSVGALALLQWAKCAISLHMKTEDLEDRVNDTTRKVILTDDERRRAAEYVSHLLLST